MVYINASYPPGASVTRGSGGPDMAAAVAALLQEERQRRAPVAEAEPAARFVRSAPAPVKTAPAREGGERLSAALENAQIEEARARIAAARALSEPAPMKSIRGGPGIVGGVGRSGLQLDTSGMTGAQRRALLPSNSTMGAIPQSGASLAASDLDTNVAGRVNTPGAINEFGDRIGDSPGINHGYGHLNPIDQSRALAALLRSNARGGPPVGYGVRR